VNAVFFSSAAPFRRWLQKNYATAKEIWIGFYKKASGKGGMIYPQALDEALCFGWIDGLVKSIDAESYMQRFTPRRPGSIWSNINVGHVARLTAAGRMHNAGLAAFAARDARKTGVYAFENRPQEFPPEFTNLFRARKKAWNFWEAQPPGYRRVAIWWVVSAKQAETRERRLAKLIAASAAGRRL
jgi:uncharacterized protein YdeI (YjbR/CyaY-like superfamily)